MHLESAFKDRFQSKCHKIFTLSAEYERQRGKLRNLKSGNLDAITTSWRFVTDRDAVGAGLEIQIMDLKINEIPWQESSHPTPSKSHKKKKNPKKSVNYT